MADCTATGANDATFANMFAATPYTHYVGNNWQFGSLSFDSKAACEASRQCFMDVISQPGYQISNPIVNGQPNLLSFQTCYGTGARAMWTLVESLAPSRR